MNVLQICIHVHFKQHVQIPLAVLPVIAMLDTLEMVLRVLVSNEGLHAFLHPV